MLTTKVFDELYAQLDPRQREAVDAIEGPVMVIAGPGTGKTRILTLRIANILRLTDTAPESILALTFTESGAYAVRKRLAEVIGATAYRVTIATFHGFAHEMIVRYPEEFPRIIGATNITAVEQVAIIKRLVEETPLAHLAPYGDKHYYVRPVLGVIKNLKREGIAPPEFRRLAERAEEAFRAGAMKKSYARIGRQLGKNKELALLYERYEAALREAKVFDFEDMIVELVRALDPQSSGHEDFLLTLQEEYQYFLADEHQDANSAQNRVLELLAGYHENPNLFIVGDEKQAIFRFQGASLNNFLHFKELYPAARIITLIKNYRSSQVILDISHTLAAPGHAGDAVRLEAVCVFPPRPVRLVSAQTPEVERDYVARDILVRLEAATLEGGDGSPPEIAVLYRDNADAPPLAKVFGKLGVPFVLESEEDILRDPVIKKILALLRAVRGYDDDTAVAEAMFVDFLGVHPVDVAVLLETSRRRKRPLSRLLHDGGVLGGLRDPAAVTRFARLLAGWVQFEKHRSLLETMEKVMHESKALQAVMAGPEPVAGLERLNAFFKEGQNAVARHRRFGLGEFLDYFATLEELGVQVKKTRTGRGRAGVRLMTAHKSKGMEFDEVYVIGAVEGHWSKRRRRELFDLPVEALTPSADEGDDRRLFYVALSRAREALTITYARETEDGREQLPVRFVEEMDPILLTKIEAASPLGERSAFLLPFSSGGGDPRLSDRTYLQDLFLRRGLSVTGLNNYMECPWRYFYTNLLRVPQAKSVHQMYGSAVHAALASFFTKLRAGEGVEHALLLSLFEDALNREPLPERDRTKALTRGRAALSGYHQTYGGRLPTNVLVEFHIPGVEITVPASGGTRRVRLTGVLDKVEMLSSAGEINVVDYKTGKPRSRNDIEGRIKSSRGNLKRQIVFYKFLLDRYAEGRYRMTSGELDFVEPNERGFYKKERFEVTVEDLQKLEEEVNKTAKEIFTLAFWSRRCKENEVGRCRFCALRDTMAS